MTKEQEIKLLEGLAERLGDNSYCGSWLKGMLPAIVSSIESDLDPSVFCRTPHECYVMARESALSAKAEADKIIEAANVKSREIIAGAVKDARYHRAKIVHDLRAMADKLEY